MRLLGRHGRSAQRSMLEDRLHEIFDDKRTPAAPGSLYDYVREISMSTPIEGHAWYRRTWNGLGRGARSAALLATVVAIVAVGLGLTVVLPRGTGTGIGAGPTAQPSLVAARQVRAIVAGEGSTCALLSDGTVECWGANGVGQLGNGTKTYTSTPVAVSGLSGVSAITAGGSHFCALVSGGTVECWGYGFVGQLGNGITGTSSSTPVAVSRLAGVSAISAGNNHTCALLSGGTVECWGNGLAVQLGDGSTDDRPTPVGVPSLSGVSVISAGVSAISAGGNHTCALLSGGTVECWGDNEMGQLGNGTTTSSSTPVAVSGLSGVSAISAGATSDHTCALLSGGTVECWGRNDDGLLAGDSPTYNSTPVAVSGLSGVSAVTAGGLHTCALLSGGTVECWGRIQSGPFGEGTISNSSSPVAVSGLSRVSAISAGGNHTCALLSGGTAECWGDNLNGQLGNGTEKDSSVPVQITGL
jgi:alpha-tubulin suppressor-like RCC1 family protein